MKKLSNEEVDKRIINKNIIRLDNYINNKIRMNWKCSICNNIWKTKASHILSNSNCPKCIQNATKLSNEIIDKRLLENKRTIKRIGNYIDYKTKIEWECLIDGNRWKTTLSPIFRKNGKSGCPLCKITSHRLSNEEIDKRILGRNIIRLDDHINCTTKIRWKCVSCGYIWKTTTDHIINGKTGCTKCSNRLLLTNEIIDERLKIKNIKRLNDCINSKIKIKLECLICGYIWEALPTRGQGCEKCAGTLKLTNIEIDKRLSKRNIKRVGEYINKRTNIEWECLTCNHRWSASPGSVINHKTGCPNCKHKEESEIHKLLLKTATYKSFNPHKPVYFNNRKYIVDFYIETKNNNYVVEYNGKQHYMPVRWTKEISQERAELLFKQQKLRDEQVRTYCKENSLTLIEIPYYLTKEQKLTEICKIR